MSRVCGLFLFGVGIGLVIALIFPKTFFYGNYGCFVSAGRL